MKKRKKNSQTNFVLWSTFLICVLHLQFVQLSRLNLYIASSFLKPLFNSLVGVLFFCRFKLDLLVFYPFQYCCANKKFMHWSYIHCRAFKYKHTTILSISLHINSLRTSDGATLSDEVKNQNNKLQKNYSQKTHSH